MTVQPVSYASQSPATTSASASNNSNYNDFLQLLITELKNQDPTKPLDPTQTVTQLATFSQVEQTMQTNALLSSFANSASFFQASALIGHTISTADGSHSGVVKSIMVDSNGLVAVLADGSKLPVSTNLVIS